MSKPTPERLARMSQLEIDAFKLTRGFSVIPYIEQLTLEKIRAAIEAERERAAQIADYHECNASCDLLSEDKKSIDIPNCFCGVNIAAAIRRGPSDA